MSRAINLVDQGLDLYFQNQRASGKRKVTRTFKRSHLALAIRLATTYQFSLDEVGGFLQQYRDAQQDHDTRYRLAARGYGRGSMWYVMAGPKLDNLDGEGMTVAHAEWVISDAAARVVSDFLRELLPAADRYPKTLQPRIDATKAKIDAALNGMLGDVRADKSMWEAANKRTVDLIATMTADQEQAITDRLNNGNTP